MKLLIINFEYPPLGGGGGVATQDLARELAGRHEVQILTTHYRNLALTEKDAGVSIQRVRVWGRESLPTASVLSLITFVPAAIWQGYWLSQKNHYDVINAQFAIPSGVPAAILAWWFKIPLVVSLVGGDLYDPSKGLSPHRHWWLRASVRWVVKRAKICTAISTDTRRRAIDIYGINKEIVVTHLGVRPIAVELKKKKEMGWREQQLALVSIGRLIPRKGYEVLLRAIKRVTGVKLAIVGDGPLEKRLKALIEIEGLNDQVTLTGYVSEEVKQQILAAADVYISASEHEGFGMVFLEAMQWGKPVIATDNGGQGDFLTAENAIIVRAGDDKALADAIKRLQADQALRIRMGRKSREKVRDFRLSETVKKFESVLLRAADKKL